VDGILRSVSVGSVLSVKFEFDVAKTYHVFASSLMPFALSVYSVGDDTGSHIYV
jgi:hypothetical protein